MNTIQVKAGHNFTVEALGDVESVLSQDGPLKFRREITPESAVTIASWWQSSGTVGSVLAAFASGAEVDRTELLDDIAATWPEAIGGIDGDALDCLSTFVINHQGNGEPE